MEYDTCSSPDDGVRRNITSYDCACAHNGTLTNPNAGQDNCAITDPAAIANVNGKRQPTIFTHGLCKEEVLVKRIRPVVSSTDDADVVADNHAVADSTFNLDGHSLADVDVGPDL